MRQNIFVHILVHESIIVHCNVQKRIVGDLMRSRLAMKADRWNEFKLELWIFLRDSSGTTTKTTKYTSQTADILAILKNNIHSTFDENNSYSFTTTFDWAVFD